MGLIQALIDEVINLPKQADHTFIGNKQTECLNRLSFSFLNLFLQTLDCVIIPYLTYLCFMDVFELGWIKWIIIILGGSASVFSITQFLYYIFFPVENYLNPLSGRIFGETAIGAFIAALFKIKIITYSK
jgi:hypothetical protein